MRTHKEYQTTIIVRVPEHLKNSLMEQDVANNLSNYVREILEQHVQKEEENAKTSKSN